MADVQITINADDAQVIASVLKQQREYKKVTDEVKKAGQAQKMMGKDLSATADAANQLKGSAASLVGRFLGAGAALGIAARLMAQMRQDAEAAAAAAQKIGGQAGRTAIRGEVASVTVTGGLRRQVNPLAQQDRLRVAGALSAADPRLQDEDILRLSGQVGALSPVADAVALAKTLGRLRARGFNERDSLNFGLSAVLRGVDSGTDEELARFVNTSILPQDFAEQQLRSAFLSATTRNEALRSTAAAASESRKAFLDLGGAAGQELQELNRLKDGLFSRTVRGVLPGGETGPAERRLRDQFEPIQVRVINPTPPSPPRLNLTGQSE